MDAVYINLDRAVERRAFMETQATALGLSLRRLPAVEAGSIDDATCATLGRSWERPLSRAELACFLSHRAAWQRAADAGMPLLVLEDDAVLSPRIPQVLRASEAVGGMEFLNLEDFGKRRFVRRAGARPLIDDVAAVPLARDKAGSAAYIVWPAGARRLLALAASRAAPADAFLHAEAGLFAFVCEPAMAIQQHVLAAREGVAPGPAAGASSVQAERRRPAPTLANLPFMLRRLRTQLRLLPFHLGRLRALRYRRVHFDATSPNNTTRQRM
ncbi:glycosyltransferase family 25 protein [Aureimonas altamirensis]|uniref:glycosyltransferase family 25 protein n=1 Tax=Aureimonas altamirensis TaxID=370622 RepID=UPI002036AA49|nr:glycosyltransferase family 25 protein [Aureimonas altamirensis]MCM2502094.1 glycosyltransferase family 25 protein [Aureimonas altamirensis]